MQAKQVVCLSPSPGPTRGSRSQAERGQSVEMKQRRRDEFENRVASRADETKPKIATRMRTRTRAQDSKLRLLHTMKIILVTCLLCQLAANIAQIVAASSSRQKFARSTSSSKSLLGGVQQNSEIHQVRGLAGSGRLELPCLVDQSNCGEVYYITWTRQATSNNQPSNLTVHTHNSLQQQQQQPQWSRVYLYTGANDSAPHKPIGDLINRAHFVMPDRRSPMANGGASDEEAEQRDRAPLAKLVIEDPRLSDGALYKCDVTYVKGKCPSISLVSVSMMSLPIKAQIFALNRAHQNHLLPMAAVQQQQSSVQLADGQLVGPFGEHEQLRLACLVQGGRPPPSSVIWRKIDLSGRTINLMPASRLSQLALRPSEGPFVQVDLNHTLTSSDLGAKFECHVQHDAIEQASARVVSNELSGTVSDQASSTSPLHRVDSLLDLHPARSSELMPGADGQSLEGPSSTDALQSDRSKSLDSHVLIDLNVGVASLDLFMAKVNRRNSSEPLKEGDLVELECVAHNSRPPANITWLNGSDSIEQLEASNAATPVTAMTAAPPPKQPHHHSRQKRLLQRNQVHQNNDGHTFTTHSFLSIKLSRHEHKAQITCQAQNGPMRQPLVKSIELQVQHAPIVLMEPAAGLVVSEDSSSPTADLQKATGLRPSIETRLSEKSSENVIATFATARDWQPASQQTSGPVSIYCIYSANPSQLVANSTRWFKDGHLLEASTSTADNSEFDVAQPIDQDPANAASLENTRTRNSHFSQSFTATGYPVLTINQVNRHDAGLYDCQLANSVGSSERLPASEACRLEVNFRPRVQLRLFRPNGQKSDSSGQKPDELIEVDIDQELIMPGGQFVLACDVLDAQPNKIDRFHWFKKEQQQQQPTGKPGQKKQHALSRLNAVGLTVPAANGLQIATATTGELQPISRTESGRLALGPLAANFSGSSFACAASNSLGLSELSNRIELQLSYAPGPSSVRPLFDPTLRRVILRTGRPAHIAAPTDVEPDSEPALQQQPLLAGRELLLECITPDLGQPRANIWLWFKNGQPIEGSSNINNPLDGLQANFDNPITGQDLSATVPLSDIHHRRRTGASNSPQNNQQIPPKQATSLPIEEQSKIRLLNSGRYLFIPSIQLIHKGNYSCVAVNRLGASGPQSSASAQLERDSYQLRVALAPSFVQPLASRTYWPEVYVPSAVATTTTTSLDQLTNSRQLELSCHVQCEPICQIEWLKNNEPLDFNRQSGSLSSNFITYQVKQLMMDENVEANLFKSVESKLVLQFREGPVNGHSSGGEFSSSQQLQLDRERTLERRHLLSGANYTCQSSPNSMGPPVRSTTKFIVQYPPENLLINAPGDKLSLVEGGNGPRLSCESSGEPQVQYRWLLVKSNAGNDLALASLDPVAKRSAKRSTPISQSSSGTAGEQATDYAINQVPGKAFEFASPSGKGANDADAAGFGPAETELIELAGATTELGSAPQSSISTLDLSNLSLDRRQSGQYICEASNRLGQARQSVYVNVQYKPTCAALHLHSLDLTVKPPDNAIKFDSRKHAFETNFTQSGSYVKPAKFTIRDEYAIVKETNEDFITLRKKLILSPLLNGHQFQDNRNSSGEFSFKDSIFQSILLDKTHSTDGDETLKSLPSDYSSKLTQFKDKDAIVDPEVKSDINNSLNSDVKVSQSDNGYSWNRFNSLLLNFLNTYMKQVKTYEEQALIDNESSRVINYANQQANRRFSNQLASSDQQEANIVNNNKGNEPQLAAKQSGFNKPVGGESTRNLITFACMAQDGNPMSNLTFDWLFGSTILPETDEPSTSSSAVGDRKEFPIRPALIYSNDNYTLHVMLVRRLDTRSILNPFQMSLLTLNIVVEPIGSLAGATNHPSNPANRAVRQSEWNQLNSTSPPNGHSNLIPRAPVIRSRQPSHYNGLGALASQSNNNNIQFARELETRPYNLGTVMPQALPDLNEANWQEQIGSLLKCSVTNHIGTSEVCHVRVNLAERMKNLQSSTSSSSEFAKWRMPSLAHKSILIISITVGCALVLFITFALLLGPYLRGLNLKSSDNLRCCKEETNTGQSTSSQKSSVLGLLGNGDSSLQSSSDDDSSARLNHHHHNLAHHHHHNHGQDNRNRCQNDARDHSFMGQTPLQSGCYHNQLSPEPSTNYDQPRGLNEPSGLYHSSIGLDYNERTPDRANNDTLESCHYRNELANIKLPVSQDAQSFNTNDLNGQQVSTRGRLLSNLKSLSKFKVDRISDLTSFPSRLDSMRGLHTKNVSSSETNTTGLSVPAPDSSEFSAQKLESPSSSESSTFFRAPIGQPQNYLSYKNHQLKEPGYHLYTQDRLLTDLDDSTAKLRMQLNSHRLLNSTLTPTYSNMINNKSFGPMSEFIRQRELDPLTLQQNDAAAFYRSPVTGQQSHPSNPHPIYLVSNDLNQFQPQPNRGPPIYPRSNQASALYKMRLAEETNGPAISARSSNRLIVTDSFNTTNPQQYHSSRFNRFSMPTYDQTLASRTNDIPPPLSALSYANTIDSHLNRTADAVALSHYPRNHQNHTMTYANATDTTIDPTRRQLDAYNHKLAPNNQSAEHIYDTNAYATPEQTPMRANLAISTPESEATERPRVSHLIQTFNSRAPAAE